MHPKKGKIYPLGVVMIQASTGEALKAFNGLANYGNMVAAGTARTDNGFPKLFVNILLFDKNYVLIDAAWQQIDGGEQPVGSSTKLPHAYLSAELTAKEPGFAYLYISNESATLVDGYFDDVTMTHTPTNIVQYNEYYPFGLQTATSWARPTATGNNFLANGGTELNTTSSLYDLEYRNYDPVLGRMNGVDPMATKYASLSPYNFSFNDPVSFTDVTGADPLSDLWTIIDRLWNEVPMDGGQTWSSESGFSGNYSSLTAFYVGANYNSQNNFWGGVDGGAANFDRAAQSYGAATGYVPLREVDVRVSPLPSGSWFTGEPYYASQTWLHDRLTEATFDYGTWLGGQYHDILDDVGLVPIIGEFADGINAIGYLTEGDFVNAGLSSAAMIPFAGWAAYSTKFFKANPQMIKFVGQKMMEIHHRIPQKYINNGMFPEVMRTSLSNLQALPRDVHRTFVTPMWNEFSRLNPDATRAQIMKFAIEMDKKIAPNIGTIGR